MTGDRPRRSLTTPRRLGAALAGLAALPAFGAPAGACGALLPPVRDLALDRFYADEAGSIPDPQRLAEHKQATAPIRDFLSAAVKEADGALRAATPEARQQRAGCALAQLAHWAGAGALLGTITTKQAEAERRWTLAGAALVYLKVKPFASGAQKATIEAWLTALTGAALKAFEDGSVKRNNHWYWMGLGAGATALATGNEHYFAIARGVMEDAGRDISQDGTLPLEMARGARALHYHAFALTALAALAEIGSARGEDWSASGNRALDRLAAATAKGLAHPAVFDTLAGLKQERPVNPGYGWLDLMRATRPDALPGFAAAVPPGYRWLGGDVRLLRAALKLQDP